jgi:phospholipase C
MKTKIGIMSTLLSLFVSMSSYAQIPSFKHVVVIFQENRTPDNLFYGLCQAPYLKPCSTTPTSGQYNIQLSNWKNKAAHPSGVTQPSPMALSAAVDPNHSHNAWTTTCDFKKNSTLCQMDGAAGITCAGTACPRNAPYNYVDNSTGQLNPYFDLATQYGFANYFFQTNQGPSFPAHQFIFGATSAPSAADDAAGNFVAENAGNVGCTAPAGATVAVITPSGNENKSIYPCFDHNTLADVVAGATYNWKYYAPNIGIWNAPNAISHICQSSGPSGTCLGWNGNVDQTPSDVLTDISSCNLANLVWVIPTGQNSDHGNGTDGGGPSWVASIVNAIGNASACDTGGYWQDTAILITWDDWGGWYDHVAPTILPPPQGDYQYGFRVPFLFVSAYTPAGTISNTQHDFGTIARFIESNFGQAPGVLGFADNRASGGLSEFYDLTKSPRSYNSIGAAIPAAFFIQDQRVPLPPDDDDDDVN